MNCDSHKMASEANTHPPGSISAPSQISETAAASVTSEEQQLIAANESNAQALQAALSNQKAKAEAIEAKLGFLGHDFGKANQWDPLKSTDWDMENPSANCTNRIRKDILSIFEDPAPGICILPENDNITKIHAMITGPFDTPYEGGFFHFMIRCPPTYPFKPPRVKLLTTSNDTVRFNPNLYKNGKVCLSILGTWEGPSWLPSQSLASVLMSIQSLLNSKPYHNEPGYESERVSNGVKNYNDIILHETLRVSVCENLENEDFHPKQFRDAMIESFLEFYDYYVDTCEANLHNDKQNMVDPLYQEPRGKFRYAEILKRIQALKQKFDAQIANKQSSDSDSEMEK